MYVREREGGAKWELAITNLPCSSFTYMKSGMLSIKARSILRSFSTTKGQEVTHALLIKLENFSRAGTIDGEIMALVPV
jgi:hypothetical protein